MIGYRHPDRGWRRAGSNAVGSVCRLKGSILTDSCVFQTSGSKAVELK